MANHNHSSPTLLPLGDCPGCDVQRLARLDAVDDKGFVAGFLRFKTEEQAQTFCDQVRNAFVSIERTGKNVTWQEYWPAAEAKKLADDIRDQYGITEG